MRRLSKKDTVDGAEREYIERALCRLVRLMGTQWLMTSKEARIAVRASSEQDSLIRHAAAAEGVTVTEFTVQAAVSHARDVLADRRLFVLQDPAWAEFNALLDRPVIVKPRLSELMAQESIFE